MKVLLNFAAFIQLMLNIPLTVGNATSRNLMSCDHSIQLIEMIKCY